MKKNVCLMRVSTDAQETISQRVAIQKYITDNRIVVDEWIEEDGVSGFKTKLEDRTALMKIKDMALNDELGTLIIFNLDRIGRRMELVGFMTLLDECGVKILSVTEGCLNEGNDTDILINSIKMWVAEYESKKKSKAVKAGKKVTALKGEFLGGVPNFGYKLGNRKLVIDEYEAEIVKLLYDFYIHYGTAKTMDKFRELGIKRRSNDWTRASIIQTLKNTIYIGKKQLKDGEIPYDESLRIISDEDFYKAQELIKLRTSNLKGTTTKFVNKSDALLEGLLFHKCPDGRITKLGIDYNRGSKKGSSKKLIYRCANCKNKRYEGVQKSYGGKKLTIMIENEIKEAMSKFTQEDILLKYSQYKNLDTQKLEKQILNLSKNIKKKMRALSNAENELEKIFMGESSMDKETINSMILKFKDEIKEMEVIIEEKKIELDMIKKKSMKTNHVLEKYKDFNRMYDLADKETRKNMLQEIIDKIIISDEKIEIKLNLW